MRPAGAPTPAGTVLSRKGRGAAAEAIARAYLELRGYTFVAANVRDGPREIDLIMERGRLVLIVEIKFRADARFGGARRALPPAQRLDLERAAVAFLKASGRAGRPLRFDFVGIEFVGPEGGGSGASASEGLTLFHLPAAFGASGRFAF